MKRPRSATLARASAAIISAAFRATASASISISTFIAVPTLRLEPSTPILHHSNLSAAQRRVFPASGRRYFLIDLTRSPGTRFVFVERSAGLQYRIDDAPCLFHIVLPRKQCSVSRHRVTEHAFVRIGVLCAGIVACQQLHLFADHLLSLIHHRQTKGSRDVRTEAESEIVGCTTAGRKDDGWLTQADDDFSACYRQRLSGSDVERD